jgi:phosphoglucomutase
MAIKLAGKEKAGVVMATDPDADRFGIAVRTAAGDYALVTGNQMGVLLADYIFVSLKELGKMPASPVMVNTIVTTGMQKAVAASYGVKCVEVLTGFKWIADIMRRCDSGEGTFVFGTEESYGYLVENEVRDKDGISASALTAEMTLYWRSKGKSLLDRLDELYAGHGYWQELAISKYFQGPKGPGIMKDIMEQYRKNPPASLGSIKVEKTRDVLESVWKIPKAGSPGDYTVTPFSDIPKSDVLQFFLEDGTVVSARPSGTEPKIKFYATCRAGAENGLDAAKAEAGRKLDAIKSDIRSVIGE